MLFFSNATALYDNLIPTIGLLTDVTTAITTISAALITNKPSVTTKSLLYMVLINGTAKEIGMAVVLAVTKSRDMEVAGAVDSYLVGEDLGKEMVWSYFDLLWIPKNPECLLSYDELPLKSSRNTFALLTILNEVGMNMYATGKFTIAMVDEPSSNGSATVSKMFRVDLQRSEEGVIGIQIMFFIRGRYVSKLDLRNGKR
ncbi:hypothetical protein Tco_0764700 [Tanacetum coccineum]